MKAQHIKTQGMQKKQKSSIKTEVHSNKQLHKKGERSQPKMLQRRTKARVSRRKEIKEIENRK